jgi:hypothetical protein
MVGMAVLRSSGGATAAGTAAGVPSHGTVWWMLLLLPACVVATQMTLWRGVFTLHGPRLRAVKERLAAMEQGDGEA